MAYQPYVDENYYKDTYKGVAKDADSLEKLLKKASRHIDTLTFNRIIGRFDDLTDFQQEIIKDVTCELVDFEYSNKDALETILSEYSINGVTMHFGESWTVKVENGIPIPTELYSLLEQTGLTTRSFYY
ncbi:MULTISPECIES: hypothetical protein [unclassified Breznakia]|uniref:hypothetical protein n=1 Tax=unclassified Breznakia TaxID=2623764 RepID=UPI0024739BA0|nr:MULTISPECIES: hypothetical protein [unclassified Breznakia]MDH6367553.1 UDP-glucose 4-epimerase [Breznakia sp. PH1-1]MDH6404653.1 UDP-glucose 4-epimerase [Breznakia sp. PF1-11]MDH6412383.1 UDP-glucose 4-epimerase [Breznakia sp. PFB1-11]MDH6414721.1 UDP-glucose 4-epimerase [Breznakia sp. PFB1-14]MDH6417034.1 UDP-glucose 4-epimerase [Breznakia sp. PFB1-4]